MDYQDRARYALRQIDSLLPIQPFPALGRHEHLGRRLEPPIHTIFDGLCGVWFDEYATEKEFEETSMVSQPVLLVELLPIEGFDELLIEHDVRSVLDRFPWWKRNCGSDENC